MVVVAIAGGSSPTLGRSIVTAIQEAGKHQVVILSRLTEGKDETKTTDTQYNTPVRYVDYNSIASLTRGLQGIHTVISVLKIPDPNSMLTTHSNLISACKSAGVSRFAPADFSMGPIARSRVDLLAHKNQLLPPSPTPGLETAAFQNGMFMNYLAQGVDFSSEDRRIAALCGLEDDMMKAYIDVPQGKLLIPVTKAGQPARISMTHIADVGRFVAAAIDLPEGQWHGDMGIVGETCTLEEVREVLAELGVHVERETISRKQCEERIAEFDRALEKGFSVEALIGKMVAQMQAAACDDTLGCAFLEPKLNQLCPDVKPIGVTEFLKRTFT